MRSREALYREWRHEEAMGLVIEENFFVEIWGVLCVISSYAPMMGMLGSSRIHFLILVFTYFSRLDLLYLKGAFIKAITVSFS